MRFTKAISRVFLLPMSGTKNARLLRAFRRRRREGLTVLQVEVRQADFTDALKRRQVIPVDAKPGRLELNTYAEALLRLWSERKE